MEPAEDENVHEDQVTMLPGGHLKKKKKRKRRRGKRTGRFNYRGIITRPSAAKC